MANIANPSGNLPDFVNRKLIASDGVTTMLDWSDPTNLVLNKASGSSVPTAVKTATTYTAAVGDIVILDTTSNAITVTLPTAPADRSRITAKLVTQANFNAVTINAGGSDVFNKAGGATSITLSLVNQSVTVQYAATPAIWYVVSDDFALSTLDTRYDPIVTNSIPTTGGTVSGNTVKSDETLYITPAGTLAALTVSLPASANAQAGQIIRVFSTQTLTSLTVSVSGGGTIIGTAVSAYTANAVPYIYQCVSVASTGTWIRLM